jgi:hypothetical protein
LVAWLVAVLAVALMAGASGCGDEDGSGGGPRTASAETVQTDAPERTFAPLVEVAADEPWRPLSARWFIERSQFGFAEDEGCEDRLIAVGRTMPELQNPTIDWIFPKGLGSAGPAYYRDPYDASCSDSRPLTVYANQLTRPHDSGPRPDGLRPGEGFYLDLADDARGGPPLGEGDVDVPVYVERTDEGDGQVRLTYWMLFGMRGTPGEAGAREGDWRRIDVLLRHRGGRYEPLAVQVDAAGDVAWSAAGRVDGTHPVVRLERATHRPGVAAPNARCADCASWLTWDVLASARDQLWYGFGGAWGEVGRSDATTGPLGPHRYWPSDTERPQ